MDDNTILSKRRRFVIFHRDSFTCQYCGRRPPEVVLEVDHIHPRSKGGTNDEINLVTSCADCNRGKSDRVLGDRPVRPDLDMRYMEAQQELVEAERFLRVRKKYEDMLPDLCSQIGKVWEALTSRRPPPTSTITQWLEHYSPDDIVEAIRITARKNAVSRFAEHSAMCAYMWGVLRRMEIES